MVSPVDSEGKFTEEAGGEFVGLDVLKEGRRFYLSLDYHMRIVPLFLIHELLRREQARHQVLGGQWMPLPRRELQAQISIRLAK